MGQNLFNEPVAADKATLREFDTAAIAGIVLKEHPLKADFETVGNDAANGVKDGDTIVLKTPLGFEHAALWFDGEGGTPRIGNIRRYIAAATITGLVDPSVWPAVDDYGQSVKITVIDGVEVGHYEHNGISWVPTKINNSYTVGSAGGGGDVTTAQLNAVLAAQDTRDDAQDVVIAGNKAFADAQPAIDAAQDAAIAQEVLDRQTVIATEVNARNAAIEAERVAQAVTDVAQNSRITALEQLTSTLSATTKVILTAKVAVPDGDIPPEVTALTGSDAEEFDTVLVHSSDHLATYSGGVGAWVQDDRVNIEGFTIQSGTLAGLTAAADAATQWGFYAVETGAAPDLYLITPTGSAIQITGAVGPDYSEDIATLNSEVDALEAKDKVAGNARFNYPDGWDWKPEGVFIEKTSGEWVVDYDSYLEPLFDSRVLIPEPENEVWISAAGDDANAGTKLNPKRTIASALATGKHRIMCFAGTYFGILPKMAINKDIGLIAPDGDVWFVSGISGGASGGAVISGNIYRRTVDADMTDVYAEIIDRASYDIHGDPMTLTRVADEAACLALPGSWYVESATTIGIHRVLGTAPDSDIFMIPRNSSGVEFTGAGNSIYTDRIRFIGGYSGGLVTRVYSDTNLLFCKETQFIGSQRIGGLRGLSTNAILDACSFVQNKFDGANYHDVTGQPSCKIIEINCRAIVPSHAGSADGSISHNASTAHEDGRLIRVGGYYVSDHAGTNDVVVDIGTCKSLNIGIDAEHINPDKAPIGQAQDAEMWLIDSTARGAGLVINNTSSLSMKTDSTTRLIGTISGSTAQASREVLTPKSLYVAGVETTALIWSAGLTGLTGGERYFDGASGQVWSFVAGGDAGISPRSEANSAREHWIPGFSEHPVNSIYPRGGVQGIFNAADIALLDSYEEGVFAAKNGSSIVEGEKYPYNSSTHGGTATALGVVMQAYSDWLLANGATDSNVRYRSEFYSALVTAGTGVGGAQTLTLNGIVYTSPLRPENSGFLRRLGGDQFFAFGAWVYVPASQRVAVKQRGINIMNGVYQPSDFVVPEGINWITALTPTVNSGREAIVPLDICAVTGDSFHIFQPIAQVRGEPIYQPWFAAGPSV